MDVMMPGMNGYEACRRSKARSRTGEAPAVVMLTSKTSPFDRIRGKMAGCDAYLSKPINSNKLQTVLSDYAAAASSRESQRPVHHPVLAPPPAELTPI